MTLDEFITVVYCLIDDLLHELLTGRLRRHGPVPTLADGEVIAIELVGESLGLDRDEAIFEHFRRYHAELFPALARVHRTTFTRQAANLWAVKRPFRRTSRRGWRPTSPAGSS